MAASTARMEASERAWDEGRKLTLDEAVALALDERD